MFDNLKAMFTPARQESRAPAPARDLEERRALLAEIDAEQAAWAETAPALERRVADAQETMTRVEELLRQARAQHEELALELLSRSLAHDHRLSQLVHRLRLGASPLVDAFIRALGALEDQMRNAFVVRISQGPADPFTDRRPTLVSTNNADRVVDAIRVARREAEALYLVARPDEAIAERLRALAATIPAFDDAVPVDMMSMLGVSPAQLREMQWRAEEPRETGRPWR